MRNITSRELAKLGIKLPGSPAVAAQNKQRVKKCGEYDSKTEMLYAAYLDLQQRAGLIRKFIHHPFSVKLGDGAKYTIDFLVVRSDDSIEMVEVKGFARSRDVVRFKWAATKFDMWEWVMRKRDGRGWMTAMRYVGGHSSVA
jgi:hypothetical protein